MTCTNMEPEGACPLPCSEGCQCEEGYALKEGLCVPKSDCGCPHRGRHMATNETFWMDWECQERCFCNGSDNRVYCHVAPCGAEEYCTENSGLYFCQPRTEAVCSAAGYGHFLPFGGMPFELQSSCSLRLLTTDCGREGYGDGAGGGLDEEDPDGRDAFPHFVLSARNEDRDTGQAIWVKGFVLVVYDYEIEVSRSYKHTVTVSQSQATENRAARPSVI